MRLSIWLSKSAENLLPNPDLDKIYQLKDTPCIQKTSFSFFFLSIVHLLTPSGDQLKFCGCWLFQDLWGPIRLTAASLAWNKPGRCRVGIWKIPHLSQQVNYNPSVITSVGISRRGWAQTSLCVCLLLLCQGISIICHRTALCRCKWNWKGRNSSNCFLPLRGDAHLKVEAHVLACVVKLQEFYSVSATAFLQAQSWRSATQCFAYQETEKSYKCSWVFLLCTEFQPSVKLAWTNI